MVRQKGHGLFVVLRYFDVKSDTLSQKILLPVFVKRLLSRDTAVSLHAVIQQDEKVSLTL